MLSVHIHSFDDLLAGQRRNDQNHPLAGGDYSNLQQQTEVELDRFEMMLPPEEVSLFSETAVPPVAATAATVSPPRESHPVKKPPVKQVGWWKWNGEELKGELIADCDEAKRRRIREEHNRDSLRRECTANGNADAGEEKNCWRQEEEELEFECTQ